MIQFVRRVLENRVKREYVSLKGLCIANSARGELNDRVGPQASGNAPWTNVAAKLHNSLLAIEINKVNRESHPNRMYRLAGDDPEALATAETVAAEQSLAPVAASTGELHAVCNHLATRKIYDPYTDLRRVGAPLPEARQNRSDFEGRTHRELPIQLLRRGGRAG